MENNYFSVRKYTEKELVRAYLDSEQWVITNDDLCFTAKQIHERMQYEDRKDIKKTSDKYCEK